MKRRAIIQRLNVIILADDFPVTGSNFVENNHELRIYPISFTGVSFSLSIISDNAEIRNCITVAVKKITTQMLESVFL